MMYVCLHIESRIKQKENSGIANIYCPFSKFSNFLWDTKNDEFRFCIIQLGDILFHSLSDVYKTCFKLLHGLLTLVRMKLEIELCVICVEVNLYVVFSCYGSDGFCVKFETKWA